MKIHHIILWYIVWEELLVLALKYHMKPLEVPFIKISINFVTQEEHDNSH